MMTIAKFFGVRESAKSERLASPRREHPEWREARAQDRADRTDLRGFLTTIYALSAFIRFIRVIRVPYSRLC